MDSKNKLDENIKLAMGSDVYLPDVDGVINCMDNYCRVLANKADVLAIVPKNKKGYVDDFPYKVKRFGSFYVPFLRYHYGFPGMDRKFKKFIYNADLDIIHVHSPLSIGRFALKAARKKNIPVVATFHTNFRPIYKSIFKFNFISEALVRRIGKLYNKLDEVFVCSDAVEEQARSFGCTGKISRIPFGTGYAKADNREELREQANEKFNIKNDETVFLYVGRLMELKRIDYILDSLKILKDKGTKFKFYICGRGMYAAKLKKYAEKLNFTGDEVIFTGFVSSEDLSLLYARSDLFLFPSLYDNFGLVKVEAAAFSTPCLTIRGSATASGITDGVNGFLSEDSRAAFAERIAEIISDKALLKQVGVNAARDIYYSWEDCSVMLVAKYREIIDRKKNPVPEKTL